MENTPGYSLLLLAPEFQDLTGLWKDDVNLTCSDLVFSES